MEEKVNYFAEENKILERERVAMTENDEYRMKIDYYRVGKPEDHYWDYTKLTIYRGWETEPLFEIERNYHSFWNLIIMDYKGSDWLLAGRDYHGGYSVFDLTNKKEYEYKPDHSIPLAHFCWINVEFLREEEKIEVNGCYWGAPYEYVTFDFSDPTNVPLPELDRRYEDDDYDEGDDDEEEEEE